MTKKLMLKEVYAQELLEAKRFLNIARFKRMNPDEQRNYLRRLRNHNGNIVLGQGSSRIVYLVGSRTVLKWSIDDEKGPAQNEAEVELYTNPKMKPIVAKIYDFDSKEYMWIVSELVKEVKNYNEWERLTGVPLETAISYAESMAELPQARSNHHQKEIEMYNHKMEGNKFVETLIQVMRDTDLYSGDLYDYQHWGKTTDGRVVILDYGFTENVRDKFYG